MKQRRFNLLVLPLAVFLAFGIAACSGSSEDLTPVIEVPEGSENYFSKSMDFDSDGSEKTLTFTTNVPWTMTVAETRNGSSWLSVSPLQGEAGTHTVRVKVEKNDTFEDRNAVITLTASERINKVFVNQKQLDALTLTSDRFEVPVSGGSVDIEVKSNIEYTVSIPDEFKTWIHQENSKTRSYSTSTLRFRIDKSEEYEKRDGRIIISAKDKEEVVSIYQAGEGILTLSKNQYDISCEAQEISVEINSNFDYDVEMPDVDWLSEVTEETRAVSSHTLKLSVAENQEYENRTAVIRIFDRNSSLSEEVTINQSQKNVIDIDAEAFTFDEYGGTFTIIVNSNVDYEVSIDQDWVKETTASSRSLSSNTHAFCVDELKSIDSRVAIISITDKSSEIKKQVKVMQFQTLYFLTDEMTLETGDESNLTLKNNSDQQVSWSSTDNSVVAIEGNGNARTLKAQSRGTATITAMTQDGRHECQCVVTVKDITDLINANCIGGTYILINNHLQPGSNLSWQFKNGSKNAVRVKSMQIIDGATHHEGNLMTVDANVPGGNSLSRSTVFNIGIYLPVTCRFRYEYKGKEYIADAVYNGK